MCKQSSWIIIGFTVLVLCLCTHARAKDNDRGTFSLAYGVTTGKASGVHSFKPSLWIDGAANVVGPLQLGGYFQGTGQDFGLKDPAFGGGALIALRPTFGMLRLIFAFNAGRLQFPQKSSSDDGVWAVGGTAGLGVGLLKWFGLEARGRYNRYFQERDNTPDNNWTMEGALAFYIP